MMSLFQCENCGCVENTALALQGTKGVEELFDWTRIEERRGMMLCRACAPTHYAQGVLTGMGIVWLGCLTHGRENAEMLETLGQTQQDY